MDQLPLVLAQAATPTGLEKLATTIIGGISLGAVYALLAVGFVIVFKATQVINFAHGAVAALGAFLVIYFAVILDFPGRFLTFLPEWGASLQSVEIPGLVQWVPSFAGAVLIAGPWAASALVAVAVAALIGLVLERGFIRPMIGQPLFAVAIITLGIEAVVRTVTNDFIGVDVRSVGDPWQDASLTIGNVRVAHTQVATILVTVVALALLAWFFRTRTGVSMRATAFDQEAAQSQGINVGRIFAISWAIAAALAAVAGVFASMYPRSPGVEANATAFVALRAFPAIIVGGLDSIVGAVLGGLIIGLAEVGVGVYLAPYSGVLGLGFSSIVPYLVMFIVLLVRPYGLFGTEEIRRV